MIQFETRSNGAEVVSRDGRLLCSPRDPVREAHEWLARQKYRSEDRCFFVVGLGAGYHVLALAETHEESAIYVFEFDSELIRKFVESHPQLHGQVRLVKITQPDEVLSLSELALAQANWTSIFGFKPCWQGREKDFLATFLHLTGRSQQSALQLADKLGILKTRQGIASLPPELPVQVKTLNMALNDQDAMDEEVKIWRSLRELVL